MKKLVLFCYLFCFLSFHSYGQHCYGENLIPNPSLDIFTICPYNSGQIDYAFPWTQPLFNSTTDYFNRCMFIDETTLLDTTYLKTVPWRSYGMGNMALWDSENYREYLEVPLTTQLIGGSCYYLEFYTLVSKYTYMAIDAIGAYFLDTLIKFNYDTIIGVDTFSYTKPLYLPSQINNSIGKIVKDTANWTKISGTFYASGSEAVMIIGNFQYSDEVNFEILNNNPLIGSLYFFDDFTLCHCEDTIPPEIPPPVLYIPNIFSPNGDGENDVFKVLGERIAALEIKICNRWGNVVFGSSDPGAAWDGSYKGSACAPGAYDYKVLVTFDDGTQQVRNGSLTLVR